MKKKILIAASARYRGYYLLFLPVAMFFLIFAYLPMCGLVIAFKDYNVFDGIFQSPWAESMGMQHFISFLSDSKFWEVAGNTLIISAYKLVFCFPAPIILALLMNEMKVRSLQRGIQTILYIPRFLSWAIIGGIVASMLSVNTGFVNLVLNSMGQDAVNFLGEPQYFRTIVIVSDIWKGAGWGSIIYFAALGSVNAELYEAARIDGAGRFRQMWHVSLSGIRGTVILMFILAISNVLNAGFDQIFVLYTPATYETGDIIDTYLYRMGLRNGQYSYAAAMGLFKSVIGMGMLFGGNALSKKIGGEGMF